MILAAVGLKREQRIVARPGIEAVAGGGDPARLEALLEARVGAALGIISIGIAGGLAPGLLAGRWIVASAVVVGAEKLLTDPAWTERLATRLPDAAKGVLLGVDRIVAEPSEKTALYSGTGALALDMESHVAARVAHRNGLAFAAARVICDPAGAALPPAAHAAMKPGGEINPRFVLRSLLAQPAQLPALIALGLNAGVSFRSLLGGCRRLGPRLSGPDVGKSALDVA